MKKFNNLTSDIALTFRRFPLPIILLALATIISIGIINEYLVSKDDFWELLALGLFSGTIFAIAGRLFNESRTNNIIAIIILEIIVPFFVILAMQIKSFTWFLPYFLPIIGVFWLSISAFTKIGEKEERQEIQDRFWILNHRAIVSAIIAFVGFLLISFGLFAIERAVAILFGLDISEIFYQYLLPIAGLFLAPLYWLSTIAPLDKISAKELENPDFLSKSIGFLGQFLFVPFLIAYALILLAYSAQIIVTQTMPVGVLGWMVLGFSITGAIAWLLVYPSFMREKFMVRLFRFSWFWLTIIPLILLAVALYIRIDAYGLTFLRILLMAGGVWAFLLAVAFLSRKFADIRLMPALAGLLFLILSIGPFNAVYAPLLNQAARLDSAISSAIPLTMSVFEADEANWSKEDAEKARGAIKYLYFDDDGKKLLGKILAKHGLEYDDNIGLFDIYRNLELNEEKAKSSYRDLSISRNEYFDLSNSRFYLGKAISYGSDLKLVFGALQIDIEGMVLKISRGEEKAEIDINNWLEKQERDEIVAPFLNFTLQSIDYQLFIENISIKNEDNNAPEIKRLNALLFSSQKP